MTIAASHKQAEPQAELPAQRPADQKLTSPTGPPWPVPSAPKSRPGRWRRLALRLALVVVTLALIGVVGFCLTFNHFARIQVEQQTTRAINLRTTVASVAVHPWAGDVGFTDFRIASPPGFATPDMLVVPSAGMRVTYRQLRDEPVHITSVTLVHPRLVIEADGSASLNLKRMAERIPHHPHPVHLVIDEVTVQDATVVLRNLPGAPGETLVPVATFTLKNLGANQSGGAPIKEVVTRLVTTLAAHASDSPQMPPQYRALIKGDVVAIVRTVIPTEVGWLFTGAKGGNEGGEKHHLLGGFSSLGSLLGKGHPTSRPERTTERACE